MKPYRPALSAMPDGGIEQSFQANVVATEEEGLLAFGEVLLDDPRGLPFGTVVHSLLIHCDEDGPEAIEFNDQGNAVEMDSVERIDVARDHVRFVFRKGEGLGSGRVVLDERIEVFEEMLPEDDVELASLCVRFELDEARFTVVRAILESASET
ncbi:MAG: hypothetical protein HOV80_29160 [Polyangiaceae bacterium]|nr:hypothetical protein [Polyangiaceae bacterium]